jgi:serralysin
MTDVPADTTTPVHIDIGDTYVGTVDTGGDHDWIAVTLVAGEKYTFTLDGYGSNALEDPYLYLRNSAGVVLVENDDGDGNRNSRIVFTATHSGTYYLDAAAWTDGTVNYTGDYVLSAQHYTAPPPYTYAQIADQLVNGYWGGDWHHFDVTQGGTITVNLTALTAAGQTLARAALQEWTDVIGVTFKEVTTGGQITFDDNQDGAFTNTSWSNHIISSAAVNVSTKWLTDYGTTTDSYGFQTYVHEIGHALGLGHAGNYNDTATYPDDALYSNDAWSTTVMSYFSQHDSSYFADQGFSEDYALTPMSADILAMQTLYGLSTTTRTGNTIYGFGSNAGNPVFDTATNPHAAYTIVDSGGTDTLDYSKTTANELIDLNPLTFSNVAGDVGNVSIAVGTVIENATSGGGNDTIIGNGADNVLNGNGGNDTVSYEAATAGVHVNLALATAQNTRGAGTDTLSNFENLTGSGFDDVLTGSATTSSIHGGDGNDRITGPTGNLFGDGGDDTFIATSGNDWFSGGAGFDTIDYSQATGPIAMITTNDAGNFDTGGSGYDTAISIERIIGSAFDDTLRATSNGDALVGGAGDDLLIANVGTSNLLSGGTGDDSYRVYALGDKIVELAGEGIDSVLAMTNYVLSANVENLTLSGNANFYGKGNDGANTITGSGNANRLYGFGGDDTLIGNGGNDTLDGGTGTNRLYGGVGNDTYYLSNTTSYAYENAGQGTDRVFASVSATLRANIENLTLTGTSNLVGKGNELANVISGNSGNNALYGFAGVDKLVGNDGNDTLDGGTGNDRMIGGNGDDRYYVDSYGDRVVENSGEGTDSVFSTANFRLSANVEKLTLTGGADLWAYGSADANTLTGNAGANKLYGMGGNDVINGGAGNDWIEGGTGKDTVTGGAGSDSFVFRDGDFGGATTATADRIVDFSQGEDHIRLNYVDANTGVTGDQAFHFIGTSAFDGTAGELRYQEISGATFVSGDTNGDGIADFMIRVDGLHALTTHDFIL